MEPKSWIYSGVGSRQTPHDVQSLMFLFAKVMAKKNWLLRSGNAVGADKSFQAGANFVDPKLVEVHLSQENFRDGSILEGNKVVVTGHVAENQNLARNVHPYPQRLSPTALSLHARNMTIVLGEERNLPVDFVVCYADMEVPRGGTKTAIAIAERRGIPVYNVWYPRMREWLESEAYTYGDPPSTPQSR